MKHKQHPLPPKVRLQQLKKSLFQLNPNGNHVDWRCTNTGSGRFKSLDLLLDGDLKPLLCLPTDHNSCNTVTCTTTDTTITMTCLNIWTKETKVNNVIFHDHNIGLNVWSEHNKSKFSSLILFKNPLIWTFFRLITAKTVLIPPTPHTQLMTQRRNAQTGDSSQRCPTTSTLTTTTAEVTWDWSIHDSCKLNISSQKALHENQLNATL